MPNHITNILRASKRVIDALAGENGEIDFATIVPLPANYETEGCSGRHDPGVVCWYEWNIANWGTKWNAYDISRNADNEIQFDTAWSTPSGVWDALAAKFPDEEFQVEYADEDFGYNAGTVFGRDGIADYRLEENGSPAAKEFAARVKYGMTFAEYAKDWIDPAYPNCIGCGEEWEEGQAPEVYSKHGLCEDCASEHGIEIK